MKTTGLITRRGAILTGLAAAGGGLAVTRLLKNAPPTFGNVLRLGDSLTYAAHRALLPAQTLAREYGHVEITPFPATGTIHPAAGKTPELAAAYKRVQGTAFADWRLSVEGSVARPRTFSLEELKQLPSRTQITRHTCEEGWTAIG